MDTSVFEVNIRYVGGLLSAYALTGDQLFRDKAQYIADKMLPAFRTPTGIPKAMINFKTGISKNYPWTGECSILSEFGTLHLEFSYLSDVTGSSVYRDRVQHIRLMNATIIPSGNFSISKFSNRTVLKDIEKPKGLYPNFLDPNSAKWGDRKFLRLIK